MKKEKLAREKADKVKRILNCLPSKETERDLEFEDALEADILEPIPKYPFQPSKLYTQKAETFYSLASTIKISSY
jgi:hypothetical protein